MVHIEHKYSVVLYPKFYIKLMLIIFELIKYSFIAVRAFHIYSGNMLYRLKSFDLEISV